MTVIIIVCNVYTDVSNDYYISKGRVLCYDDINRIEEIGNVSDRGGSVKCMHIFFCKIEVKYTSLNQVC